MGRGKKKINQILTTHEFSHLTLSFVSPEALAQDKEGAPLLARGVAFARSFKQGEQPIFDGEGVSPFPA